MTVLDARQSMRVARALDAVRNFTTDERMLLAKLLLESVIAQETGSKLKSGVHSRPKVDMQAFADAAGSWHDVDTEAFVQSVRQQRDHSYRPSVEL